MVKTSTSSCSQRRNQQPNRVGKKRRRLIIRRLRPRQRMRRLTTDCAITLPWPIARDQCHSGDTALFTQPPMRRMRICFTDVFLFFFVLLFPFATKISDNRSRERLNGFSWNFYQTIAGKMEFASPYPNGGWAPRLIFWGLKTTHCKLGGDTWQTT